MLSIACVTVLFAAFVFILKAKHEQWLNVGYIIFFCSIPFVVFTVVFHFAFFPDAQAGLESEIKTMQSEEQLPIQKGK